MKKCFIITGINEYIFLIIYDEIKFIKYGQINKNNIYLIIILIVSLKYTLLVLI